MAQSAAALRSVASREEDRHLPNPHFDSGLIAMLPMLSAAALFAAVLAASPPAAAPSSFDLCGSAERVNCIVDGDTLWIAGIKIRIADIDAPELHGYTC